jgi:hypothetical protein
MENRECADSSVAVGRMDWHASAARLMRSIFLIPVIFATCAGSGFCDPLYTQTGTDQPFEEVMSGGKVGEGAFARPEGTSNFRWGMYLGKNPVKHDAMIFVSGATVNGK